MPSRSNDPLALRLEDAAAQIAAQVLTTATANPVVLIDGRSGAGKTSLAARVVATWPLAGRLQVVALDSLYPGWDGLEAGAERARELILIPHGRGVVGTWRRWDWDAQADAESHAVDPALPLLVEGCGVLTPRSARLADVTVWVDGPASSRKHRALTRDGDAFRPHWDRWAAQEEVHIRRDDPRSLADLVIDVP